MPIRCVLSAAAFCSEDVVAPAHICRPRRDDDTETPDRSHKPVPDWAKPAAVLQALKAQRHVDPDTIFGAARRDTCDLAEMFKGERVEL